MALILKTIDPQQVDNTIKYIYKNFQFQSVHLITSIRLYTYSNTYQSFHKHMYNPKFTLTESPYNTFFTKLGILVDKSVFKPPVQVFTIAVHFAKIFFFPKLTNLIFTK